MRGRSRAWLAALGLVVPALAGCAAAPPPAPPPTPAMVLVLLPDETGEVGQVTLSRPGGDVVLTRAGEAVQVTARADAPAAPFAMPAEDVGRVFGTAIAVRPTAPARFLLYFEDDADTLTAESRSRLAEVVQSVVDRRAVDVSIVGHTDTVGTRAYNFRLGLRRAQRVQEAIRALPIDQSIVRVDTHGKDAPLIASGDNVAEPRNRRVEVTVR